MRIYVASSWRNGYQPEVVNALRELGHDVYDFRNPPQRSGFSWREIDDRWQDWTVDEYIENLNHPTAIAGFTSDFDAMQAADACVLVMPCGRSAHIEAGYFVGANKKLLILASKSEPELMYKMADSIHAGLGSLLLRLQEIEGERISPKRECCRASRLREHRIPELGVIHTDGGHPEHVPGHYGVYDDGRA